MGFIALIYRKLGSLNKYRHTSDTAKHTHQVKCIYIKTIFYFKYRICILICIAYVFHGIFVV